MDNVNPRRHRRKVITRCMVAVLPAAIMGFGGPVMAEPDYASVIQSIARDIAALREAFPALTEFSPDRHAHALSIEYAFHTHKAGHHSGWTSGVPNPDEDGLWFYIDIHDPDSTAQIHTQPAVWPPQCLGEKRVSFLILMGKKTRPVAAAIGDILKKHGITTCQEATTTPGVSEHPIAVRIAARQTKIERQKPVLITVTVTNSSEDDLEIATFERSPGYLGMFALRFEAQELPLKRPALPVRRMPAADFKTLKPGERWSTEYDFRSCLPDRLGGNPPEVLHIKAFWKMDWLLDANGTKGTYKGEIVSNTLRLDFAR